jgi:hypothetical protein
MTISAEVRLQNALALLALLYQTMEDAPIDLTTFDSRDGCFTSIQETSWDELVSEGLLSKRRDSLYFFTAKGWSEAVIRAGDVDSPDFQHRLGQLSKALKDKIKGRQDTAFISLDEVANDSGLPSGWVFNAIDSHLLCRIYGKKDAIWFEGTRGRVIEVPRDFGLVEIDLFADVRSENLRLTETVEQMEELYSDYRCSFCSAPLVGRSPWDHEYGSEEVMEYACGMTVGAPYGDVPCTQSATFPKLEDYVLTTQHDGEKWWCFAHAAQAPSTANSVILFQTWGRTEEEAKEAMRKQYAKRAKPWKG